MCVSNQLYVFTTLLTVVLGYYYYTTILVSSQQTILEPPCDYAQFNTEDFQGYKYKAWQLNFTIPASCSTEDYRISLVQQTSEDCFTTGYGQSEICDVDLVTAAQNNTSNDTCNAIFNVGGYRTLKSVLENDAGNYAQIDYRGRTGVKIGDVTVFGQSEALNITTFVVFSIICTESSGDAFLFVQSTCNSNRSSFLSSVAVTGDIADDYCYNSDNLSGWEIALIVIACILGVCLLILLLAILIDACTPTPQVKTQWVPESVPLQDSSPQYQHGSTPAGYPPIGEDTTPPPHKAPLSQVHTPSSDAPVPPPVVQQSSSHTNWPHTLHYPNIDDQNIHSQPKV